MILLPGQDSVNPAVTSPPKSVSNPSVTSASDGTAIQVDDTTCEQWETLATQIMTLRQNGAAMSQVLKNAEKFGENQLTKDEIRTMVIKAYKSPGYQTSEMKQKVITEFGNKYMVWCIEVLKDEQQRQPR